MFDCRHLSQVQNVHPLHMLLFGCIFGMSVAKEIRGVRENDPSISGFESHTPNLMLGVVRLLNTGHNKILMVVTKVHPCSLRGQILEV